jgi:hypothetical protein
MAHAPSGRDATFQPPTPNLFLHLPSVGMHRPSTQAASFIATVSTPRMDTSRSIDFFITPRRPKNFEAIREDKEDILIGTRKGPRAQVGMRVTLSRQAGRSRWHELSMERVSGIINIVYDDYVWVKWDNGAGHWHNTGKNQQYDLCIK